MNCCSFNPLRPNHNRQSLVNTIPPDDSCHREPPFQTSHATHDDDQTGPGFCFKNKPGMQPTLPSLHPSHVLFRPGCWDLPAPFPPTLRGQRQKSVKHGPRVGFSRRQSPLSRPSCSTGTPAMWWRFDYRRSFAYHFNCSAEKGQSTPLHFRTSQPIPILQSRKQWVPACVPRIVCLRPLSGASSEVCQDHGFPGLHWYQ
ncbi:hypothetical protein B0T14DRAFT_25365 [Immersiella caudata]|uniref:Uncharacterized protein n=1 Tax=Immersiella caudata TaxID=314043 RepID=A0AA39XEH4_9PEZI|nr:hypothetical protein B0T14DRAFT_25365 [Immersiella caudata]